MRKIIILDGKQFTDRDKAHHYLANKLNFPSYYGKNLDALYDVLSTINIEDTVCLIHPQQLVDNLGDYGYHILSVMLDAKSVNKHIDFRMKVIG